MYKSATDIVNKSFDKVAKTIIQEKATSIKGEIPNYEKAFKKAGINTGKKSFKGATPLEQAMKNGAKSIKKEKIKNFAKSNGAKAGLGLAGLAALGGSAALAMKKRNQEKTAFDIVEESFDKIAGVGAIVKPLITATANLGKNSKGLYKGVSNMVKKDIGIGSIVNNKGIKNAAGNVAKGMVLPTAGVAGVVGTGMLANKAMNHKNEIEKAAFEMMN